MKYKSTKSLRVNPKIHFYYLNPCIYMGISKVLLSEDIWLGRSQKSVLDIHMVDDHGQGFVVTGELDLRDGFTREIISSDDFDVQHLTSLKFKSREFLTK